MLRLLVGLSTAAARSRIALRVLALSVVGLAFSAAASAAATPDCAVTPSGGNLCVLSPSGAGALQASGGATLSVARDIVVDSSSSSAATISGSSTVTAQAIGGPGGFMAGGGATYSPAPVNVAAQPDPYASATPPAHDCSAGGSSLVVGSGTTSAPAGKYSSLGSSGGTLNLDPGVYSITGSFTNNGSGHISGTGVTIYLCPGASLHLGGTSVTTLTAPSGGFVLYSASASPITFDFVTATLTGTFYAPSADLGVDELTVNGDVVVNTVNVHSGGSLTVGTHTPPSAPCCTTTTTTTAPVTTTPVTTTKPVTVHHKKKTKKKKKHVKAKRVSRRPKVNSGFTG